MYYINYKMLRESIDKAGGILHMCKATGLIEQTIHNGFNGRNMKTETLFKICDYLNQHPKNFIHSDTDSLAVAAEPEGEYNTPGANINRIILERLTIIQDKFDTCTAEMIKKIDHLEMLVSEKH